MTLSEDFEKRSGGILKLQPEVTDNRFLMFDTGGIEASTGEFLYGFIRRLKPQSCLETGIYSGISSLYTAQALKDNGFGHLQAVEYEQFHIDRAQELWGRMGIFNWVTAIKSDSLKFVPDRQYQFMFLDTEPYLRFKELVRFYPNLDEGGYVFIHDTPRNLTQGNVNPDHPEFKSWPFGEVPTEMKILLDQRKLMPFYFGMARGMVGFYKLHKDDFIWKS